MTPLGKCGMSEQLIIHKHENNLTGNDKCD